MRVCMLVHELSPSGGVNVILSHARGLQAAGHEVVLVATGGRAAPAPDGIELRELRDVRDGSYDWAVATWWETAPALYELDARRRMVLLQSFEQRFYTAAEPLHQLGAAAVLALPADFVVVSEWMCDALGELTPDAQCVVVRNGVDKQTFASRRREPREGPLRVLVEGQPTLWFKGVRQALEAARAMAEPAEVTLVAIDPSGAGELDADRVVGGLSREEMAELYADTDVLVKLSRIEGLGLPLVEAAHVGVPCVVTPFGAHADLVEHGRNGLVVGHDDRAGVTWALDLLARDRDLLERLSAGALERVQDWPDLMDSGRSFAAALDELDSGSSPPAEPAVARLLAAIRLARATARGGTGDLQGVLDETTAALAQAQSLVHELSVSRDDCAAMLDEARSELDDIRSTFSYRAVRKARALVGRRRG